MATLQLQPTPQPLNPTTDSEETPPTTNQQTQEPVDPQTTTTASSNGNTEEDISTQPGSSEGINITGTELRVPMTSETDTDRPILTVRPSESTDIGLIVGSAAAVITVITLATLTVVIVVAVLSKKHGKSRTEYSVELNNKAITVNQAGWPYSSKRSRSGRE